MLQESLDIRYATRMYKNILENVIKVMEDKDLKELDEVVDEELETLCIYTSECKEIISYLDYDIFSEHEQFGLAKSWEQSAYYALHNLCYDYFDIRKDFSAVHH